MGRQPRILKVIADGGRRKGGTCYGSFCIDGYPGESEFAVQNIDLITASTSSQAEAEILRIAVAWAVAGIVARNLRRDRWAIEVRTDDQTLKKRLTGEHRTHNDFIGDRVRMIQQVVQGFARVEFFWVERSETVAKFGH